MPLIKCCKDCVEPVRFPGCKLICPDYMKERAALDLVNYVHALNSNNTLTEGARRRNKNVAKAKKEGHLY